MKTLLSLNNIECRYHDTAVVKDLSFNIRPGMLACLLGQSGCGKTTVLRAIAGFEPLHHGEIVLHDQVVSRPGFTLAPEKRGLGMVFQDYALFPHLDVAGNIGFALSGKSRHEKRRIAEELLETVGLKGYAGRYPHELSGGQQQRIALARALAHRPDLILMDEPFSNLDVDLRERLGLEVRDILKQQGIAAILVTHDQHEAFALGDMVGIMKHGRILQWDTPFNLYHEPADRFVADFIGQGVFLDARLISPNAVETEVGIIEGDRAYPWPPGTAVEVLLRPDDIVPDSDSKLTAEVVNKAFKGATILYTLRLPTGNRVLSLFPSHDDHPLGAQVGISINADHLISFQKTKVLAV
ncbi:hypothetical protein Tel_13455 [Candidatus Tenderia electrophaga]|jgi:iron(III) transport system ATP-binding protein|uniref:ABC transporter domain-containing protein n=1 Tax=Candidatus Tenderia electrophaga TaxID=1748243 RepID=A0A0S2TG03_9GAMM|nr:hypothetical protein Tel_13455 [Candidatus Tenderia electrophaga]